MRQVSACLVATALAFGVAPLAHAATPQQTYGHYVDCASQMMALQIAGMRENAKDATKKAPDMGRFVGVMRDKAVAAGKAVSAPEDRVVARIDQGRDRLVKLMDTTAPPDSKPFGREIGMPALSCAFDELGKAIDARKAKLAAQAAAK